MSPLDHERIRAYLDGELSPDEQQRLLTDARARTDLRAELDRQTALYRLLNQLPDPPSAPLTLTRRLAVHAWGERVARLVWSPRRARAVTAVLGVAVASLGALTLTRPVWMSRPSAEPRVRVPADVPVRFQFHGQARSVSLAGSFNGWSPDAAPLRSTGPDEWEATLLLPHGEHRYIFQVDGRWQPDGRADQLVPDGMGNLDAVLRL